MMDTITKKNDIKKLIAAVTMLIDHIGAVFFKEYLLFRIIGRIAFPIFAYYIASGFIRTSDIRKYIIRMFSFAIITEIPFIFFSKIIIGNWYYLNVLFTFSFALLILYYWEKKNYLIAMIILIFPEILSFFTPIKLDYGSYGIIIVLIFYYYRKDHFKTIPSIAILTFFYVIIAYFPIYGIKIFNNLIFFNQLACLMALPIIYYDYQIDIRLPKYFFYIFYPLHVGIIVIIYYFLI